MSEDSRLVYSSDPSLNKKCFKCKELLIECICVPDIELKNYKGTAVIRIEKSGRGGKIVTVIDQLPRHDSFLKDLTGKLKKNCGSGGTYFIANNVGVIEIQGEKRDLIRKILAKENIKCKG